MSVGLKVTEPAWEKKKKLQAYSMELMVDRLLIEAHDESKL